LRKLSAHAHDEPVGRYEDSLRALGGFLEAVSPSELEVLECGKRYEVSWRPGTAEQTRFQNIDIHALRRLGPSLRMRSGALPVVGTAELLGTIGSSLDQLGAEGLFLRQTERGYSAVFRVGQSVTRLRWSRRDLVALAATPRSKRYPHERALSA